MKATWKERRFPGGRGAEKGAVETKRPRRRRKNGPRGRVGDGRIAAAGGLAAKKFGLQLRN